VVGLATGSPIGDANRRHVMQAPMQGNVYPVDLRTVYPTLGPSALGVIDTTDEGLEKRLGALENVSTVFSSEQMSHCGMRVVKEMANGGWR
jgi:hypothetical protein